ncbi:MAG: RAMP superfamily CRISPR-associated protein [Prevotella sp.]|jgi:CRISPR/Cas system CSM-associated protein Csm3 (group 7 of RAMP superfamily)|nr:RAMP superfamily CRISPR-associated protein [Prevotella sp.]
MKAQDAVKVIGKVKIEGMLTLQSPLLIGAGKVVGQGHDVDTYILRGQDDKPLIPGTSLAGVLRSYVMGINPSEGKELFGYIEKDADVRNTQDTECQSAIAIDDVVLENAIVVQRDGVSIDSYTHTAIKGKKYDYEAVERGAYGHFEAVITLRGIHQEKMDIIKKQIKNLVAHLQSGFPIGALTTKGFGHVSVKDAAAQFYDFTKKEDVLAWLQRNAASTIWEGAAHEQHNPRTFYVDADFALRSSLIIRDYDVDETIGESTISAVQKMSNDEYVIPGTSLKGVLRHQAERIFRLTGKSEADQMKLKELMGYADDKKDEEGKQEKQKSNFYVDEVYMKKGEGIIEKEQSRNRIDRFTSGTIESALFTTKPIWQEKRNEPTVRIHYEIHECEDWQAGLALFLLRDLWQGDVAVGGEKSIGRGTLQGISAQVEFNGKIYNMGTNGKVEQEKWHELEQYAQAFVAE